VREQAWAGVVRKGLEDRGKKGDRKDKKQKRKEKKGTGQEETPGGLYKPGSGH
jgi:hypothetical protein